MYPFILFMHNRYSSLRQANVASVMCSYNDVNGTDACADPAILGDNGLLRKNGFRGMLSFYVSLVVLSLDFHTGFVVSDWFATYANATAHANAGLDMEMPGGLVNGQNLTAAVRGGTVSEEVRLPLPSMCL